MIVSDGDGSPGQDGTYTVRFYTKINGVITADYVTVDSYLPVAGNGYFEYAGNDYQASDSNVVLWAALIEKAYAQWSAEGFNDQLPAGLRVNAYSPIGDGDIGAAKALRQLTGQDVYVATDPKDVTYDEIIDEFAAGLPLVFGTKGSPADSQVVSDHDYALIGFDAEARTVTLFNPWGLAGGTPAGGSGFFPGELVLQLDDGTDDDIVSNYDDVYHVEFT
jgi:hypothetical protein